MLIILKEIIILKIEVIIVDLIFIYKKNFNINVLR